MIFYNVKSTRNKKQDVLTEMHTKNISNAVLYEIKRIGNGMRLPGLFIFSG